MGEREAIIGTLQEGQWEGPVYLVRQLFLCRGRRKQDKATRENFFEAHGGSLEKGGRRTYQELIGQKFRQFIF